MLILANGPDTLSLPGYPGVKYVEDAAVDGGFMVYGVSLFAGNQPTGARGDDVNSRLSLPELVERTGGGYIQAPVPTGKFLTGPTNDGLVSSLANVVDELRHQYVLGFAPQHRDGRTGKVAVRVKRPEVTVSARKTYRAPERTP